MRLFISEYETIYISEYETKFFRRKIFCIFTGKSFLVLTLHIDVEKQNTFFSRFFAPYVETNIKPMKKWPTFFSKRKTCNSLLPLEKGL